MMRRVLHELDNLRAQSARNAEEIRKRREAVRGALADVERDARKRAEAFSPPDLGAELRPDLTHRFQGTPARRTPDAAPNSLEAAKDEWERLRIVESEAR